MNPPRPGLRHRLLRATLPAALLVAALHAQTPPPIPAPLPSEPENAIWEFPSTFDPTPARYSGLYFPIYNSTSHSHIKHRLVSLTWDALNPYENEYRFDLIDDFLNTAATGNYMILFRLKASVFSGSEEGLDPANPYAHHTANRTIPAWVTAKYSITSSSQTFETKTGKRYVAPWHAGVQKEFKKFLYALNRRKYIESPHCIGFYLHGVSASGGEEMHVEDQNSTQVTQMLATVPSGSTLAQEITTTWTQRMNTWRTAAGPFSFKVAWVGASKWSEADYNKPALDDYALSSSGADLGIRHGFLENYFYTGVHPDDPSLIPRRWHGAGQFYIGYPLGSPSASLTRGYIETDWTHPIRDGRFWADELEETDEYGLPDDLTTTTGFTTTQKWAYRSAFFRAAQVGLNFAWASRDAVDFESVNSTNRITSPLINWYLKVAGKPAAQSPDAICWLREARVRLIHGDQTPMPWNNMERLVMQRDVYDEAANGAGTDIPGAVTQLAARTTMLNVDSKGSWSPYGYDEFLARKTNNAADQRIMAFKLDPAFMASLGEEAEDIEFRVQYYDEGATAWTVRIPRGTNAYTNLSQVVNQNTLTWKTAIFRLPGAYFTAYPMFTPNSDTGPEVNFALRLNSGTPTGQDLTVRFVRIVRTAEVAKGPTIRANPQGRVAFAGETVRLSVDARGPGTLSYLWKRGTTTVATTSVPEYVITNLDGTKTGNYTVTVSNGLGTAVTSTAAAVALADTLVKESFASGTASYGATGATLSNSSGTLKIAFDSGTGEKITSKTYAPLVTGTNWDHPKALRFKVRRDSGSSLTGFEDKHIVLQVRETNSSGERFNYAIGRMARSTSFVTVTIPLNHAFLDPDSANPTATFNLTTDLHVRFMKKGLSNAFTIYIDDLEVVELQDIDATQGL